MEQTLFYKAQTTGAMWDTWLYWREGTYYLYHLAGHIDEPYHYGIAMATSNDGVHWREHGLVLEKAEDVSWLGTGSTWEASPSGAAPRFIMNFSECRGTTQTIFFAESADLLQWRRLGNEYEFRADKRWYKTAAPRMTTTGGIVHTIERPGGGRYGYWTANPRDFTGFGFGETDDGATWRALPPPRLMGRSQSDARASNMAGSGRSAAGTTPCSAHGARTDLSGGTYAFVSRFACRSVRPPPSTMRC